MLQIWDIGGQSAFFQIRQNYLRGSQGAFVLFDVTNRNSLMHVDAWIDEFLRATKTKNIKDYPIIVIGNKIDLDYDDRLKLRAKNYLQNQFKVPIPITYTSAKEGIGMNEAFEQITKLMINKVEGSE